MKHKSGSAGLRVAATLVHLALWAQLGVLTRGLLGRLFELGCGGGWGPCLAGGVYFRDLPANMLGSFVIGLFAASSAAGLATEKALVLLPKAHPWQSNFELQIGVRTGYCGSLTTFASWQLELMRAAIQSNQWMNAVFGFLIGLYAALVSYVLGMHTALAVDRWLLSDREDVLSELEAYRSRELQYIRSTGSEPLAVQRPESPAQALLETAEWDIPRLSPTHILHHAHHEQRAQQQHQQQGHGKEQRQQQASVAAAVANGNAAAAADGSADGCSSLQEQEQQQQQASSAAAQPPQQVVRLSPLPGSVLVAEEEGPPELQHWYSGYRTDTAALAALLLLTAGFAAGGGLETQHAWLRALWLSCLLGPFGCLLRWQLSRCNYKLRGAWAWLPAGTLAANMLGCLIDFALECILRRGSPGYWGQLMITVVQGGFCGALTTVSTFVTEVVKFAEAVPEQLHACTYALLSLGGGAALGIVVYGWSVWAP